MFADGSWLDWGDWSLCSRTCGADSHRRRIRRCGMPEFGAQHSTCRDYLRNQPVDTINNNNSTQIQFCGLPRCIGRYRA